MKIVKRSPENRVAARDLSHAFSDLFSRFFEDDSFSTDLAKVGWNPKVDIYEKSGSVVVKADVPGIEEKNLNVELENNILTISGVKEEEHETKEKNYHRVERNYGSFCRSITLPDSIVPDKIEADYKKGVLTVNVPKSKESIPKKVTVKVS